MAGQSRASLTTMRATAWPPSLRATHAGESAWPLASAAATAAKPRRRILALRSVTHGQRYHHAAPRQQGQEIAAGWSERYCRCRADPGGNARNVVVVE